MQLTDAGRSTADLVERCRAGDAGAWEALVERFGRLVHAIAVQEGLGREDAADVTQEVFVALMEQLDDLQEPDRVSWWLMTVARRRARRWRERAREGRHRERLGRGPEQRDDGLDEWVEAGWVLEAVGSLDEPCRSLLELLFLDPSEPSYAQVAHRLDMPVGSIGSCRARCLGRLRRRLEPDAR